MLKCGTFNLKSSMPKLIFILIAFPFLLFAEAPSQDLLNRLKLQITEERLRLIKENDDLDTLNQRIIREHKKLATALAEHPQIMNSKLSEPKLAALKLKLLAEDEDLNDRRLNIIKLHRSLEDKLMKNKILKRLYQQLETLQPK